MCVHKCNGKMRKYFLHYKYLQFRIISHYYSNVYYMYKWVLLSFHCHLIERVNKHGLGTTCVNSHLEWNL
jgi:hypothetical protein